MSLLNPSIVVEYFSKSLMIFAVAWGVSTVFDFAVRFVRGIR